MTLRPVHLMLLLVLSALGLGPARAHAQTTRADSAEVLLAAANGFQSSGRQEVAEAIYRHLVERYAETPAAALADARIMAVRSGGVAGAGRVELQVWTTTYGLFLGVLVPLALGAEDMEGYGLGLLAGGPAGYAGGRALARARPLTEGQARAITWGGTWGTWQGFGWALVMDLGTHRSCAQGYCYDSDEDASVVARATLAGGLAGIAVGAVLSRRTISPGAATTVNLASLWGSWFGFVAGVLTDREDDALLGATLVGGNVGLVTAALLAPRWNPTRTQARVVSIAGVVGGVSGLGLDLLLQPEDEKTAVAIPLITSVVGLALGAAATADRSLPDDTSGRDGSALLNLGGGVWSLGTPVPTPVLTEVETKAGYRRGMALAVPLVGGRF